MLNPQFVSLVKHPLKFRLFMVKNLPAAFFSGVRVAAIDQESSTVTVPYKWFSTNPFQSTYFACLAMAAEMSTGILALGNIYGRKEKVGMLVKTIDGQFLKKATGVTTFVCRDGNKISDAIEQTLQSGEVLWSVKRKG